MGKQCLSDQRREVYRYGSIVQEVKGFRNASEMPDCKQRERESVDRNSGKIKKEKKLQPKNGDRKMEMMKLAEFKVMDPRKMIKENFLEYLLSYVHYGFIS
ncbi:hypothetical protein GWI33_023400 [Rhynchophorus ferrugineus]|uniref:Uncharacterized protein n=1 Tax=Rhynchophorus ferrugineus TaxID=354439 RepID=A0A834ITE9_RHYFE|nr:hypothetical protein GWI33_023400 [Rhynchophorus ferrugineus]